MRSTAKRLSVAAGAASLLMLVSALAPLSTSGAANAQRAAKAKYGGTLTMLGTGDVQRLDANISYYTVDYLAERPFVRQLYTEPANPKTSTTVVPDMATAMPVVTNGGKTYTMTIRKGIVWNSSPPRQVTGADFIRGLMRTCNPTVAFGGTPDFNTLIAGYETFCNQFAKVSATSASAQAAFMSSHQISGVKASGLKITIHLTQRASYFTDILAFPALSPCPVEYLKYLPSSAALQQHLLSDGPYAVQKYDPEHFIDYVRNPDWKKSTDPIRKAYVDKIDVIETDTAQSVQQQLETNTEDAMEFNATVPTPDIANLIATKNPNFTLNPSFGMFPYFVFNTSTGPLKSLKVRQALEYAINRRDIIQNWGGEKVNPPLTGVLPNGIGGSKPTFDMYPYNLQKAKALLKQAGYSPSHPATITFLYASNFPDNVADFQTVQAELAPLGVNVKPYAIPQAQLFTVVSGSQTGARTGKWNMADVAWFPDWYGNAAKSFFGPLFDGRVLPPRSNNDGLFNSKAVNTDIDKALASPTVSQANKWWHKANVAVMAGAAIYPVNQPYFPNFHSSLVQNCVYVPDFANYDPTNVWLSNA